MTKKNENKLYYNKLNYCSIEIWVNERITNNAQNQYKKN